MRLDKFSFQNQVEKYSLFTKKDILLLGISGGMDSMVLAHLLEVCGYRFHLAHVNFGLRGEESDGDEDFIRQYASGRNISLHIKRASKSDFNDSGKGIQETARDLRYEWFEVLANQISASYVVLAHHQDDQSETVVHQFLRGGMLAALRGMRLKSGKHIRPILSFSRNEILRYAQDNNLSWREDSSNQSNKYTRNFIRHEVMPMLQKINPDIQKSIASRAIVFEEMERLVQFVIQKDIDENVVFENDKASIACDWLKTYPYKQTLIWQLMSMYHFSSAQLEDILNLTDAQSGAYVENKHYIILKDRGCLLFSPKQTTTKVAYTVSQLPFQSPLLQLEEVSSEVINFSNPNIQYVNLDRIDFPLYIRTWQEGDKINPLGMSGTQKVSDILIQQKIALTDKANVLVIADNKQQILAVVGLRISDNIKVTNNSKRILKIQTTSPA